MDTCKSIFGKRSHYTIIGRLANDLLCFLIYRLYLTSLDNHTNIEEDVQFFLRNSGNTCGLIIVTKFDVNLDERPVKRIFIDEYLAKKRSELSKITVSNQFPAISSQILLKASLVAATLSKKPKTQRKRVENNDEKVKYFNRLKQIIELHVGEFIYNRYENDDSDEIGGAYINEDDEESIDDSYDGFNNESDDIELNQQQEEAKNSFLDFLPKKKKERKNYIIDLGLESSMVIPLLTCIYNMILTNITITSYRAILSSCFSVLSNEIIYFNQNLQSTKLDLQVIEGSLNKTDFIETQLQQACVYEIEIEQMKKKYQQLNNDFQQQQRNMSKEILRKTAEIIADFQELMKEKYLIQYKKSSFIKKIKKWRFYSDLNQTINHDIILLAQEKLKIYIASVKEIIPSEFYSIAHHIEMKMQCTRSIIDISLRVAASHSNFIPFVVVYQAHVGKKDFYNCLTKFLTECDVIIRGNIDTITLLTIENLKKVQKEISVIIENFISDNTKKLSELHRNIKQKEYKILPKPIYLLLINKERIQREYYQIELLNSYISKQLIENKVIDKSDQGMLKTKSCFTERETLYFTCVGHLYVTTTLELPPDVVNNKITMIPPDVSLDLVLAQLQFHCGGQEFTCLTTFDQIYNYDKVIVWYQRCIVVLFHTDNLSNIWTELSISSQYDTVLPPQKFSMEEIKEKFKRAIHIFVPKK